VQVQVWQQQALATRHALEWMWQEVAAPVWWVLALLPHVAWVTTWQVPSQW
jgi:hypothetical protein